MKIKPDGPTLPPDGRPIEVQPRWRREFPIDWSKDQYIARRDFTRFLVLTSAAFAVGQLWVVLRNVARRGRGVPPIQEIARLSTLQVGTAKLFAYPGPQDHAMLLRLAPDRLVAYDRACTHLSCPVVPQLDKKRLFCPCHEGVFDPENGRPIAGPPQRPLRRITLEVRGDRVYATGVAVSS